MRKKEIKERLPNSSSNERVKSQWTLGVVQDGIRKNVHHELLWKMDVPIWEQWIECLRMYPVAAQMSHSQRECYFII